VDSRAFRRGKDVSLKIGKLHPWTLGSQEAMELQRRLAERVSQRSTLGRNYGLFAEVDRSSAQFSNRLFCRPGRLRRYEMERR
jgi:hypothetical protein